MKWSGLIYYGMKRHKFCENGRARWGSFCKFRDIAVSVMNGLKQVSRWGTVSTSTVRIYRNMVIVPHFLLQTSFLINPYMPLAMEASGLCCLLCETVQRY